ncbi:NFACT family protein [Candidatus Bipolaricaulota bacterium]|nr:NFACT family protein [Candidatus Bipolaricaulota bacterium]
MDGLSIAASLGEIAPRIVEGTIRTIYQPDKTQFVFRVFAGEELQLVIDLGDASIRTSTCNIENPIKPSMFVMLLRKHLRGSRLVAVNQIGWDRVVAMDAIRRDGPDRFTYRLIAELVGTRGNLHLLQDGVLVQSLRPDRRNSVGRRYVGLPSQGKCDPKEVSPAQLATWLSESASSDVLAAKIDGLGRRTAGDLVAQSSGDDLALDLCLRLKSFLAFVNRPQASIAEDESRATFYPLPLPAIQMPSFQEALNHVKAQVREENLPPQDTVLRDLKRAILTREKTIDKLVDWLNDSSQADAWQAQADLLMIFQSDIPRGQTSVVLADPTDGCEMTLALDPSLSAIDNAQSLYKRAKRIRRGHPHVHIRLKRLRCELTLLQSALEAHQRAEALESAALDLLPKRTKQAPPSKKAIPFRQFEVAGYQIWMGKSARQNDALLKAASPNDLWMHAKDYAGSHVVVRAHGQERIPDAVVHAAARLAALHSKAKSERRVEVTMTQVKRVRKPKGVPAGLVTVREADTLTVDLEEGRA